MFPKETEVHFSETLANVEDIKEMNTPEVYLLLNR